MNGRTGLCLAIGVGLTIALWAVVLPDSPEREIALLNRQITVDLPVGTSLAEVEKWLKNREMAFQTIPGNDNRPGVIWAQAHSEYFWYWSGWLMISFSFDEQDRLMNHHIEFEELAL